MFIVIIGPDGSGKTSVAQAIDRECFEQFGMPSLHMHGDFDIMPRLKILRKFFSKMMHREMKHDPDYTVKHAGAEVIPHSVTKSLIYITYYYWDYLLGHFTVQRFKTTGQLLIADRYFYDYFYQRGNMNVPYLYLRVLSHFIPKPDLTIFLSAPPEVIYKRKNELTVMEIERQQNIIMKISKWLPNILIVDNEQNLQSVVNQINTAISIRIAQAH